ncbi:MAG: DUF2889 domain-containing protein [Rhodocyclaceae bacterium]|jgi:hypothetical protein|nr:DUF2889 domain-containing protein [Rhodocyclaceae bacterium]
MTLPPADPRQPIHQRAIICDGYKRDDGLWEVEGQLRDIRGFHIHTQWRGDIPQGSPFHDMLARITYDDDLVIRQIAVVTATAPYPDTCPKATDNYQRLVGLRIGGGFAKRVQELVGGVAGCAHQTELFRVLGAVAMQTLGAYHTYVSKDEGSRFNVFSRQAEQPMLLGSCHAYAPESPVVAAIWPRHAARPSAKD